MTTFQIIQVGILSVLGLVCLLVLAFLLGSLWQLGREMTELKHELFETDRDIKSLEKMRKEHDEYMQKLEHLEKEYQDALLWYANEAERQNNLWELFMKKKV